MVHEILGVRAPHDGWAGVRIAANSPWRDRTIPDERERIVFGIPWSRFGRIDWRGWRVQRRLPPPTA